MESLGLIFQPPTASKSLACFPCAFVANQVQYGLRGRKAMFVHCDYYYLWYH
jgi:hypothetical protein